jgi:hypothetical protein
MVGNIHDAVGLAVQKAVMMKPQQEPSTQEVLAGLVERVTFHNAENGFTALTNHFFSAGEFHRLW